MKLISMTDFVLEQLGNEDKGGHMNYHDSLKVLNYAKFLKQPLKLEMFVPCDEEGNFLEDPKLEHSFDINGEVVIYEKSYKIDLDKHQKAKEKVLFEGFEIKHDKYHSTKRSFIWMPDNIKQVWRRLEYHSGKIEETFAIIHDFENIEDLISEKLILTPSAIKQFS